MIQANREQIVESIWSSSWRLDESDLPVRTSEEIDQIRKRVLQSLKYEAFEARRDAIMENFGTTYDWIFSETPLSDPDRERSRQALSAWMQSTEEATNKLPFWITGKPGSGKSVMMKYISEHPVCSRWLDAWTSVGHVCKASYFAWRPGNDLGKCRDGLFRSILHAVLDKYPELTAQICPRYWALFHLIGTSPKNKYPEWTARALNESFDIALAALLQQNRKLFLLVDGLDEFSDPPIEIGQLIMSLVQSPVIKAIVASRNWPQFSDAFHKSPVVEMHSVTKGDIENYVIGRFHDNAAFRELNAAYSAGGDELLGDLLERAEGVFLWVVLVTNTLFEKLIEGAGLSELQTVLNIMPQEIGALYDTIFESTPVLAACCKS